jgi:protein-disulfide isomerase
LPAAAILGALLFAGCTSSEADSGDPPTPTPELIADRIAQAPFDGLPVEGTFVGEPEAPLLIEMYEDFGCPHCLEFTSDMEPHLLENYVEPGHVRLQYRFFPLRQVTANAAIAAWCAAEQDQFWPYHEELFIAQANANEGTGPDLAEAFDPAALGTLAEELGLDVAAFDACTTSEDVIDVITSDLRTATELDLPGTPSFVINGEVLEDVPETRDEWTELLDGLLEE